ncbi:reactive intermediate/imine deaminase [Campylobacter concisus]|uniref:Reactive intermediate/imine deaminase n=1 Tax=Campylobacter concisus TaxID=199 RepID=A0A1Y5MTR6_9BACT|nr:RidA family protein [Campylobacter concisus]OUT10633.1 reactive intermediate/imine deaminase [Campylobacter concisus]
MKKQISTKNAPQAIGPYSQAISANGFLFISGQLGVTPAGEFAGSGVEAQAEQSLENLKNILAEAGLTFDNAVKTTIFLADMGDFAKVNTVYAKFFKEPYPARSTVAVKTLPKDALVEIELIAAY